MDENEFTEAPEAGSPEPEEDWSEGVVYETSEVDLTPVVTLMGDINDNLMTQHNDLLQLQTNVNCVLLAVCMLAGVVIGCAVSYVLHDLWRA